MAAVTNNLLLRAFWKFHRRLLALSGGTLGIRMGPGRQLLLITKGRKSGEPRPVALSYVEDDGRLVVVATNAGEDRHPAWWLNLEANPNVEALVNGERLAVTARAASGEERTRLYQRFIDMDDGYAEYVNRTKRTIPVVVLERS
jgi:deazaflavin-dependent oxidoreductase (nitroreductase family)